MGNLPAFTVTESRRFTDIGIDYLFICLFLFILKQKKFFNRVSIEVYVDIFACLTIKRIYLAMVTKLTTESFFASLRRFISHRGYCARIYSDKCRTYV